jgi:hypothetical protein
VTHCLSTEDEAAIVIVDSVTELDVTAQGSMTVTGSHGGSYAGYVAARAGVSGVVFNDAGVGRDRAGVGALAYLDACSLPSVTVDHGSARIGDGADTLARGIVSHVNRAARTAGCCPAMTCREAVTVLSAAKRFTGPPPLQRESRYRIDASDCVAWAIDSAALVVASDAGAVLVTGSHGGLLGGRPETALRVDALAALFNDAGVGIDGAGIRRLPALDVRRIAAATVAHTSARIGDARSTYEDGTLSAVNATAFDIGVRVGDTARDFVARIARAPHCKAARA